ncbi:MULTISPECIES: hypothetical protein [Sorangium]|uniref:Phage baseplate protein n=1 Tax=Sorangium cellulosum (strain So ce56) TaxID=448385 RepID=A9FV80_SORC5|nr:hypothetical protein [Sorangium cellulosum]CAN92246.1 hypothetical protein sce2087 [Sorangium cellulosum So ce56]
MRGLSSAGVLLAWEAGLEQHPLDRALSVLGTAHPELDRGALAALTVGQRDSLLIALRRGTFGDSLGGFAECGACGERLEFALSARDFPVAAAVFEGEAEIDGLRIHFRLPTSRDLAAVVGARSVEAARRMLLERCVLEAAQGDAPIDGASIAEEAVQKLAERMAELDAAADLTLELACPACGHAWETVFDIESYFWAEIAAQAGRLLAEVHTLASAYGWDEARILGMSAARRQAYLDRVAG